MKKVLFIFYIFLIFGCEDKESNSGKVRKNIITYFYLSFAQSSKPTETCFNEYTDEICPAVITYYTTNIKSFKIYQNSNLIFESSVSNETIYAANGCSGGNYPGKGAYAIKFQSNPYLEGLATYAFKNGNFCGLKFGKQGGPTLQYEMPFNGDLNTFTEINAGEYRFVAVR